MKSLVLTSFITLMSLANVFGQQHTENATDQALKGSGRVNPSTLGMEISIPLGSYPGRGINVPISLSYSSKLWRMDYISDTEGGIVTGGCRTVNEAKYGENSASGWTTSLAVPYIEYTGMNNLYNDQGLPFNPAADLCPNAPPSYNQNASVKRLTIHLPSGETHELRANDTPLVYAPYSRCPPSDGFSCDPNDPRRQANWNTTFYAVDGSNIRYIENSTTSTYRIKMPDGSFYDFATTHSTVNQGLIRKATRFTDRNGNFTTYDTGTGAWTDTLGRTLAAPIGEQAPAGPDTITYSMPGLGGSTTVDYKFYWKKLKGTSAAESGLTDFGQDLKYRGPHMHATTNGNWELRSAGTYLFHSDLLNHYVLSGSEVFNPIVLTEIELPTGQKYKFSYDIYGRIEKITYPTGGVETFVYGVVPPLAVALPGNITEQTNFGVTSRRLYPTPGGAFYEWTYSAEHVQPAGYKVSITSPDGTSSERFLHRGADPCSSCDIGTYGYDNGLAGMPFKQISFDSAGNPVSMNLTHWTQKSFGGVGIASADWHPRVTHEENIVYDPSANGDAVSATVKYEYEGDLDQRDTPLLVNKTTQYAFVAYPGGGSLSPVLPQPGESPVPEPSPIPTATPTSSPVKIVETSYLIYDTGYPSWVRDNFIAKNMVGLVRSSTVKDGSGTVVSRSETLYDEGYYSPEIGRGNPTTLKVWDSTKGAWDNSNAYIATRATFDTWGNQIESWDAKENKTTTTYDGSDHAFPIQVTSPVPDPSGQHGSTTEFVTTTTFDRTTGLPKETTDANGIETRIEYDPVTLRPLNTKTFISGTETQIGSTAETIYNDQPNNYWVKNRSQIDENNWIESITYFDGLGRAWKSERIHSGGNIYVEKEFDSDGRVLRVTNPFRTGETKQWTTNVYDDASRVIEVVLPDGAKVKTDYAVSVTGTIGISKQITDQAGKKRKGITDALGRMVQVIEDPSELNLSTDYVFDTLGNLRRTIQGEQSRYFYHDSLGRLLRAKQPEQDANPSLALSSADPITGHNQWSVGYEYDDNGNITKTTDARNVDVQGTYDNLNRLKLRIYSDATPDVSFYYDGKGLTSVPDFAAGKTTKVSSSVSVTRYTSFDRFGRLLTHEQETDGKIYSTAYEYNLSGALIEETYPSGRKVKNALNNDGELSLVQSGKCLDATPGTNATCSSQAGLWNYAGHFTYDTSGAVTKMQLGNGKWETAQYNNRQQITQMGLGTTDTAQDLLKLELGYGDHTQNNGSLREQTISFAGLADPFQQTYTYDDLNRIQSATETVGSTETWKQTFTIDRYGNRRFNTGSGLTTTLGSCTEAVCNPTISTANNQFTSAGYDYDANGNLIEDAEERSFVYDAENHQIEVKDSQDNTIGEYVYDGEGRRVKKIAGTELTIFVYNAGGHLVAEYSSQISSTPQVSYLTTDHLGSPRVITNENGVVTTRKDYTAFGEVSYTAERTAGLGYSGAEETRKGYTGYEKDGESGLDYAQARYYNSVHGRFTSVDPLTASASIRNPQTFNRYSYVLNSPYKYVDPMGLSEECRTCSASGLSTQSIDKHRAEEEERRKKEREEKQRKRQQAQAAQTPPETLQTQGSVIKRFELLTTGENRVPDTPHPEVPNAETLGFTETTNGGYLVMNVQVTFKEGTNVADYRHVRTAFVINTQETRSGSDENPSKSQTEVDGQDRFVYDNPGVNVTGVPRASLNGETFAAVFVAGEFNKKTKKIDPNVVYYGIKIVYGKAGAIDRSKSAVSKISRADFIRYSGIKDPEKSLKP